MPKFGTLPLHRWSGVAARHYRSRQYSFLQRQIETVHVLAARAGELRSEMDASAAAVASSAKKARSKLSADIANKLQVIMRTFPCMGRAGLRTCTWHQTSRRCKFHANLFSYESRAPHCAGTS